MSEIPEITKQEATLFAVSAEDQFYDRKSKDVSGKGIQKAVVAFANADGGELVIGIRDGYSEATTFDFWDGAKDVEYFKMAIYKA
ncbi:MAG: AlbA family DNA-binding domain-containing protein [Aliihoeflea sp.]|uniref:AlbA family DNA-binding domain-containing protein n=1 Tax=Aliihoeflea sp. TaxID=2608088 RepID=UPI0040335C6F